MSISPRSSSVLISADYHLPLPKWFTDKYKGQLNFSKANGDKVNNLPISSKFERKFYC
jgi:hypothetical protein